MPRGPVSGATAALIRALAEQGVHVSVFQIERWRASGHLPRPIRHGRGRGRGVFSEPPDEATVAKASVLARSTRQGSRTLGTHPVERVALRLPVSGATVRHAIEVELDRVAAMTAADVADPDAGWQARQDAVDRAMRERGGIFNWQDLVDAVDDAPVRRDPSQATRRAAFAGIIHAIGGGEEALPEDLTGMFGLYQDLAPEQVEAMRRSLVNAELSGEESWAGLLARLLSVHHMRRVAAAASFDDLRRAIQVVSEVAMWQSLVVLLGLLDLAGEPLKTGTRLDRFDGAMIRQLQSDPMWHEANTQQLSTKPRQRVTHLVISALGLLISGRLPAWEAYRDRLVHLAHPPHLHETEPVPRKSKNPPRRSSNRPVPSGPILRTAGQGLDHPQPRVGRGSTVRNPTDRAASRPNSPSGSTAGALRPATDRLGGDAASPRLVVSTGCHTMPNQRRDGVLPETHTVTTWTM